jgi:hypothetical protein
LGDLALSQEWLDSQQKSRRRSTIHSYTISTTYHTLPKDANTLRQVLTDYVIYRFKVEFEFLV